MKYIDLTHTITDAMPTHPLDSALLLKPTATYQEDGIANHVLTCSVHAGTHIDAPGHFTDNDKKITDFPLSYFIGNAVCIDVRGITYIDIKDLENTIITQNDIVLLYTGFDKKFYEPDYFYTHPVITQACADYFVKLGVKMVGVDFSSVDQEPYNVHKTLLAHNILIIENLAHLDMLIAEIVTKKQITVFALPLKIDAHGALARVVACVQE
jgi:kynurenine formamidase